MHLFTYGTLMAPEIMQNVAGCVLADDQATLAGYQRYLVRNQLYPGMIKEEGAEVEGVLYYDLPVVALARLDSFEGTMYLRREVMVKSLKDNSRIAAMVYIVKKEYIHLLTGTIWSYDKFLAQGRQLFEEEYQGYTDINDDL